MGLLGGAAQRASGQFVLHHGPTEIALRAGETYLIGRSVECKIVLADHMVSRRHARLVVGVNLLIEDLGSANGVYVDGKRIQTIRRVSEGQRIQIGGQELIVGTSALSARSRLQTNREPISRRSVPSNAALANREPKNASAPTDQVNFPGVLLELTGRLLNQSRSEEAEKLVEDYLNEVLGQARQGAALDKALTQRCAQRALDLAAATGKASWLSYVFELYSATNCLLPEPLINESYRVVRLVRRPSLAPIRGYVSRMALQNGAFGPSERFLLKRLYGLEQMASAR
jgi:pSer/pThr/pTyr-binding forkhead associated (FHA) protein